MTDAALAPGPGGAAETSRFRLLAGAALTALLPILLALLVSGAILWALGKDPVRYYVFVVERGLLSWLGLQETLTRMAPLLLLGASLIVAFRAGIWNLGGDGQFLLAAVVVAALGPLLVGRLPVWGVHLVCLAVAAAVGAMWAVLPAVLRAFQQVNEIITTLMMSFLGVAFANVLVKLVFRDPTTTVPQTRTLEVADRLPRLLDTTVHAGLLLGLAAVVAVHLMMTRTAFGLRLQVVGANPRAAAHAGLDVAGLTVAVFAISAGLAGLAGAVDVMGVLGNVQADWNPAYGLAVVPLVFLARFNGFAVIGLVFFYAALSIGAKSASVRLQVPQYFVLVLVGLMLLFLAVVEYIGHRRRARAGGG